MILQPRTLDYKGAIYRTHRHQCHRSRGSSCAVGEKARQYRRLYQWLPRLDCALVTTGNRYYRNEAFVNRQNVSFMPFDGYFGENVNTVDLIRANFLQDESSGLDLPAAVILANGAGRRWHQYRQHALAA